VLVPGEAAIVIGGALASQGRIPLSAAIVAAILGAIVGDTIGYGVGKRWGEQLLPRLSRRRARNLEKAKGFLRRHPGWTVALGRFPPGIRTFVPGAAGMSHVRYRSFLVSNVAGAIVWGSTFVLLGYAAGRSWRRVEALVARGGLILLAAVLLAGWIAWSYHRGALASLRRRPRAE